MTTTPINLDRECLYAKAFKHGARAALEYLAGDIPELALAQEDHPSPIDTTLAHIDGTAALIADPFGCASA